MLRRYKRTSNTACPQRLIQIQGKINNTTWAWAPCDSSRALAQRLYVGRMGQGRPQAGPHCPQKGQLNNFPGLWRERVSLSQPNPSEKGKDAPHQENGHVYNHILKNTYNSRKCQQVRNPIWDLSILSCPWRKLFPQQN